MEPTTIADAIVGAKPSLRPEASGPSATLKIRARSAPHRAQRSIPMAVVLLTALFTVHLQYGFFSVKLVEVSETGIKFGTVGYEIILLYLAGLASLAIGGAGPLSMDSWRNRRELNLRMSSAHPRLHEE
jgi:hypothetical protein